MWGWGKKEKVLSKKELEKKWAETWVKAARMFATPPFSNGHDDKYEEVKAMIRSRHGREGVNDDNKARLKTLALSRGQSDVDGAGTERLRKATPLCTDWRSTGRRFRPCRGRLRRADFCHIGAELRHRSELSTFCTKSSAKDASALPSSGYAIQFGAGKRRRFALNSCRRDAAFDCAAGVLREWGPLGTEPAAKETSLSTVQTRVVLRWARRPDGGGVGSDCGHTVGRGRGLGGRAQGRQAVI